MLYADLHGRDLRPGREASWHALSIILPEHAGIISDDAVRARAGVLPSELLQLSFRSLLKISSRWTRSSPIVGRAGRAWRGGRLGRRGHAAARSDSACVGSWSMDAGRRSACMPMNKEWLASGQPCRGLQGSGWGQPVGSMHRCTELPCGPQAPESTRSCDT